MTRVEGDPARQAKDALRGYIYQILRSILVWIDLGDSEELYLEGAEDLDRIDGTVAHTEQVKDTAGSGNVTLRTPSVAEAINNYWAHATRNPGVSIHFRYVTTSGVGVEQGAPFGAGRAGIDLWNTLRAHPDEQHAKQQTRAIANFLQQSGTVSEPVKRFLAAAAPEEIVAKLIAPIEWLAGQQDGEALVRQIRDRLVVHGNASGVAPADAELVFDALYTAAFDAAKAKDDRPLSRAEFLRIFAAATAIQVPKQELLALMQAALAPGHGQGSVRAPAAELESAPPLPTNYFRRALPEQLLADAVRRGAVLLHGSTGSGKTLTAASTFVAQAPLWLTLRDLNPAEVKSRLTLARDLLRAEGKARILVVDDIDTLSDPRVIEGPLAALWHGQKALGGMLIVTSDRVLPARLSQAIELEPSRELQMTPFDASEIERFLRQSGCPDDRAETWSKLLEISTFGHPQLVNARVGTLSAGEFPTPGAADLFQTPPDIDRIRFEAHRIISGLPDGARELLYRASLLTGRLNRQRLMAAARFSPPVAEPGTAIDTIAGPWLELTSGGEFRVSPLARGSAEQARGTDWVKAMHGQLAWIYLLDRTLTPWDISSVLMHCYIGGTAGPLVHILQGIYSLSEEVWEAIGEACGIYTALALEEGASLPFNRPADQFVFRLFQYRIAAETAPDTALRIASKLEAEFSAAPDDDVTRFFRWVYLSQVLSTLKVTYPLALTIHRANEFIDLGRAMEESLPERMERAGMTRDKDIVPGGYAQFAGLRLMAHIQEIDDFAAVISALKLLERENAAAILGSMADPEGMASLLIERLWLHEYGAKRDAWSEFRSKLRAGFDLAVELGVTAMARGIAAVLVRVIDEDIGDPKAAVAEAQELMAVGGDDPVWRAAYAKVLSHSGDFPQALEIWKEALPRWSREEGDLASAFTYRSAAVAAGAHDHWSDAAAFFDAAKVRAERTDKPMFVIGLAMDAAFARFMAGERAAAIAEFGAMLATLEPLQANLHSEPLLSLQRRIGGVLSGIAGWIDGKRPEPELKNLRGICSDVDPFVTEAAVAPPLDTLRIDFLRLDAAYGETLEHSLREAPKVRATPYVAFRAITATPLFQLARRTHDFEHVVADGLRQTDAFAVLAEQLAADDRDVMRLDDGKARNWTPGSEEFVIGQVAAAAFDLAAADELDRLTIAQWRADAAAHPQAGRIVALVDHIGGLFVTGDVEPWPSVVRCASGDWSHHLVSALAASLLERLAPEPLLRCHALWVHYLNQPYFRDLVPDAVATLATRQWRALMTVAALFAAPRISLVSLRGVIDDPSTGWAKTGIVLRAALEGVPLAPEDDARKSIEALQH